MVSNKDKIFIKRVQVLLSLSLATSPCFGEYRAYQYLVRNVNVVSGDQISYIQNTSLNPRAFVAYHGGGHSITIDLLQTWACPGNTAGRKPICPSPYSQLLNDQNEVKSE